MRRQKPSSTIGCSILNKKAVVGDRQLAVMIELAQRMASLPRVEQIELHFGLGKVWRSGSTLTEQILASHPRVFDASELNDFNRAVTLFAGQHGAHVQFPDQNARRRGPGSAGHSASLRHPQHRAQCGARD
jgi:hypothetical protein